MRETAWAIGLLGLVVAVALTASAAMLLEPVAHAAGVEHPRFATMEAGGDAAARHGRLAPIGLAVGTLLFVLLAALMGFAYRDADRLRFVAPWLIGALLVHVAFLVLIFWTYRGTMNDRAPAIVAAFPAPTAWFLFGLLPAKFLFIIIFLATFDRAYWRPQDEQRLHELCREGDAEP